jgi:hypothetical protein
VGQFLFFGWISRSGGYNRRYSLGLGGSTVAYNPDHTEPYTCIYTLDMGRGADSYTSLLFY